MPDSPRGLVNVPLAVVDLAAGSKTLAPEGAVYQGGRFAAIATEKAQALVDLTTMKRFDLAPSEAAWRAARALSVCDKPALARSSQRSAWPSCPDGRLRYEMKKPPAFAGAGPWLTDHADVVVVLVKLELSGRRRGRVVERLGHHFAATRSCRCGGASLRCQRYSTKRQSGRAGTCLW